MTQTTTTTELSWSETMELLSNKHPGLATLKHSSSMARHSKLQSKSNSGNNPTNNKTTKPGTEKLSSRRSYGFLIFDYIPVLLIIYAKVVFNVVYALSKLGVVSPKWVKLPEIDPKEKEGYAPIRDHHTRLFQFTLFNRISDLFARPINTLPADTFRVIHRPQNPFSDHVEKLPDGLSINMASYNYLGFSTNTGPIPDAVKDTIKRNGLTFGSNSRELGTWQLHRVLEKMVAKFVGKEDAILCPMGFATNSMHLPALADDRTLIISDEHNHSSLILGCKLSGATIKVFKHNDTRSLEKVLEEAVIFGEREKCRKWKKILIIVEGAYSMEGTIVNLPEVIRLKKKYKAYLYVDEAHSIGALGPNGKGVADLFKTGTKDIDILMGTFTKSFAAFGGYISASKEIINHLRVSSHSPCYAQSMSPPVMQQIASTLSVIQGHDGTAEGKMKIQRLRQNAVYMRENLQKLGFHVYGHPECPIVPVKVSLICLPWVSRMMQAAGVSIVVVGSPAVAFFETRIRFCLSASHSRQQIDKVIDILDQIGHVMCAKKNKPDSFAEYRAKNMLRHRKGNYIEMADFIFG